MLPPVLTKYSFRIRTRIGLVVDNLMIHGHDEIDAQRKLRQIYRDCEILDCVCHRGNARMPPANLEDVLSIITR